MGFNVPWQSTPLIALYFGRVAVENDAASLGRGEAIPKFGNSVIETRRRPNGYIEIRENAYSVSHGQQADRRIPRTHQT